VTAENQGDFSETFDVSVYYDSILIETKTVTDLPAGTSTILEFFWDTTGAAEGIYTIKAEASVVPGETDTADNTYIDGTVEVFYIHDVAIIDVKPYRTWVYQGDLLYINVTVENQGDVTETFDVTAYYYYRGCPPIETKTVTDLAAGANTTLTFEWNTAGLTIGLYEISAVAEVVPYEIDIADNTYVYPPHVAIISKH